jgi:membrane protein YdbS with pleckstrin-like domain
MKCPHCEADVAAESSFCSQCGERLSEPNTATDRPVIKRPGNAENARSETPSPPRDEPPAATFKEAISKTRQPDEPEVELWRGGYSPKAMIGNWIASGMCAVVLIIVAIVWLRGNPLWFWLCIVVGFLPGLYYLVELLYRKLSVRYLLTNQRFMHESGVLRRITNRIEVLDMDDITFEQGLVERMLGVGSIRVHSSDVSHPELFLHGIDNVAEVANLIDNTRRTERRKRGLHIESI